MKLLSCHSLYKQLYFSILLLACAPPLCAQLIVDFDMDQSAGCAPLTVAFTNKTTGAGNSATWHWNFGNGNSSAERNPGAIFTGENSYTVTLTVQDGTAYASKTKAVTVYKKPTVGFSADVLRGCASLPVTFSPNAAAGDGAITQYFWDFGDGITEQRTAAGPVTHTYSFEQVNTVSLTVTNSHGCQTTLIRDSMIEVLPQLKAEFAASQTFLCQEDDPVSFSNTSIGSGTLSYLWTFGDGSTSTLEKPVHIFGKKGTYGVSLTVTSSEGCARTVNRPNYLNVSDYRSEIIAPELSCTNRQLTFTNRSTPAAQNTSWHMEGIGSGSGWQNGTTSYWLGTPGTYHLRMINTFESCKDTVYKDVDVKKSPKLEGFVAENSSVCQGPITVQFRDTTEEAKSWAWDFRWFYNSTNVHSTDKEPTYQFNYNTYNSVNLTVTNEEGCTASILRHLDYGQPNIAIRLIETDSRSLYRGCVGMKAKFGVYRPEEIASYQWIFPGGATSSEAQPEHIFTTAGRQTVTLNYVTSKGCPGTATYTDIWTENKPTFDFVSESGTTICGNTPVRFTGTGTRNQDWYWYFGDGETEYTYNGYTNSTTHKYEEEGVYTVTLVANAGGCFDTLVKKDYLTVKPPFPKIAGFTNTCEGTRGEVTLTDGSRQAESWRWDFGDGGSLSYTTPPAEIKHTYTKTGTYMAVLTTTNGGCTVKDSLPVRVLLKQDPVFSVVNPEVCKNDGLEINVNNLEYNPENWTWYAQYILLYLQDREGNIVFENGGDGYGYNDGPKISTKMQWLDRGVNMEWRAITRSNFFKCLDTTNYVTVTIKGPEAGFSVSRTDCSSASFLFTDTSKSFNGRPIVSWQWHIGTPQPIFMDASGAVSHTYPYPDYRSPYLKITDADGCWDQAGIYLAPGDQRAMKADFSPSATAVAPGTTVSFTNNTFDDYQYNSTFEWIFGDGGTSTLRDPQHTFTTPGTYEVLLIAHSANLDCTDTARKTIVVKYINPAFRFDASYLAQSSCPPVLVRFTNTSTNAARMVWEFGDGATAENVTHPSHVYHQPGLYRVRLRVFSDNGTEYVTEDSVRIKGAVARLEADRLLGCTAETITLRTDNKDGATYFWDFGDGTVLQTGDSLAVHPFSRAGVYAPSLVLKDADGCLIPAAIEEKIIIDSLYLTLGALPANLCDQAQVSFQPTIVSVAADQGQQPLSYSWDFGTGNAADISDARNPVFGYHTPGTYPIRLRVESPSGCVKEASAQVVVHKTVKGTITGPEAICEGSTALFTGAAPQTDVSWKWLFGQGATASVQNPAAQAYTSAGNYSVQLVVTHEGCADTATAPLLVHPAPRISLAQSEPVLCAGSSVQLEATGAATYQWQPATGLSDPTAASPLASPASTTTFTLEAQSAFGCSVKDSVHIIVAQPFRVQAGPDTFVCAGDAIALNASGAYGYRWIGNTDGLSNTLVANPMARPATTTAYTVEGYDAYGCFTDKATVTVRVVPLPTVAAGPDLQLAAGMEASLQPLYSPDVTEWLWTPADQLSCSACPTPQVTVMNDAEYIITVKNSAGCAAADTISVKPECRESRVFIPNAFTPNRDAHNSTFSIRGSGATVRSFRIFNRWGELLFERKNFRIGDRQGAWNGMYKGLPVPAGSYVYFAELQCPQGTPFIRKGTVTVLY